MLGRIATFVAALIGIALLLVAAVALLPARAVKLATDRIDGLTIGPAEGRLYGGEADVAYRGYDLGRMAWSVRPGALFNFELGVDWHIAHRDFTGTGIAVLGAGTTGFTVDADIDARTVNQFLAQYHISLDGVLEVRDLAVRRDSRGVDAEGTLHWSGGRTTYRLSGETHDVELPAMVGNLAGVDGEPVLEVVSVEAADRLLTVRLDADGWAHIGVTGRLTSLAGNAWRYGDDEDAVVVTVSERLFEPPDQRPRL